MAVRIFAVESMYWRVVGKIKDASAMQELAQDCSIVKVYASEAVGYVVDEGVQIHGGYGYHRDYAVERFYRDARIFRIFEGTNEINRVLISRDPEVGPALADIAIQTFALESAELRAQKLGEHSQDMCALVRHQAEERIASAAREIHAARGLEPPVLPSAVPVDTIALRRKIARRLLDAGRYVV